MKNWEQYQTAYQAADQTTKDKLHSSLIPECVSEAVQKYELDISHKKVLIQLFADKVLGITDDAEVAQAMRSVGIPAAAVISKEIDQCITTKTPSISDTSLVEGEPSEIEDSIPPKANKVAAASAPETLAAELAETEAAFHQLQPIRTMASDMQTLKQETDGVHQAVSQDTLLQGQGNAQKNPEAQWGTEQ